MTSVRQFIEYALDSLDINELNEHHYRLYLRDFNNIFTEWVNRFNFSWLQREHQFTSVTGQAQYPIVLPDNLKVNEIISATYEVSNGITSRMRIMSSDEYFRLSNKGTRSFPSSLAQTTNDDDTVIINLYPTPSVPQVIRLLYIPIRNNLGFGDTPNFPTRAQDAMLSALIYRIAIANSSSVLPNTIAMYASAAAVSLDALKAADMGGTLQLTRNLGRYGVS